MKNNENKIYIKTDRNFYFSGDTISGKIFIDITELINSKGVQLTIKGKEIIIQIVAAAKTKMKKNMKKRIKIITTTLQIQVQI